MEDRFLCPGAEHQERPFTLDRLETEAPAYAKVCWTGTNHVRLNGSGAQKCDLRHGNFPHNHARVDRVAMKYSRSRKPFRILAERAPGHDQRRMTFGKGPKRLLGSIRGRRPEQRTELAISEPTHIPDVEIPRLPVVPGIGAPEGIPISKICQRFGIYVP